MDETLKYYLETTLEELKDIRAEQGKHKITLYGETGNNGLRKMSVEFYTFMIRAKVMIPLITFIAGIIGSAIGAAIGKYLL